MWSPGERVRGARMTAFWQEALAATGDPDLGLHLAEAFTPGALDIVGYVMLSCPTALEALRRGARGLPPVVVGEQRRDLGREPFTGQVLLLEHHRGAGRLDRPRVGALVVVGGLGKRHEDGGAPGRRQFRQRGGTGAADHDIGGGHLLRHVGDEGPDVGVDAGRGVRVPAAHGRVRASPPPCPPSTASIWSAGPTPLCTTVWPVDTCSWSAAWSS